jgi:YHS domain-containing protein
MDRRITRSRLVGFSILLGAFALTACQARRDAPTAGMTVGSAALAGPTAVPRESESAGLTVVADTSQVCMVNNQFMGRPQIPVEVDGKTYYGCCAMCKGRLQSDAAARTAVDPVTNAPVDKASAVIGKTATGSVVYFANLEHFQTYARGAQKP